MKSPLTHHHIVLTECPGSGESKSVLIVLPNTPSSEMFKETSVGALSGKFRTFVLTSPLPASDAIGAYVKELLSVLSTQGIRRGTFFGIGAGAAVVQAVAAERVKVVRRAVLLDATARMAPGFAARIFDRLERMLPLGLPLRKLTADFDSRPFLHRIHCPTLILTSPNANAYLKDQSEAIARSLPNAWLCPLTEDPYRKPYDADGGLSKELSGMLSTFLQVPATRSQKGLSKKRSERMAAEKKTPERKTSTKASGMARAQEGKLLVHL